MSEAGQGKDSGRLKTFATALALVATIESLWIGFSGIEPNRIEDEEAAVFLSKNYFPAVVRDPVSAMNRWGTAGFQTLHHTRGLDSYRNWYQPVREIPPNLVYVNRAGDADNTFVVQVVRILKAGDTDRREITMHFECVDFWQSYLPWSTCEADNLRLDFTVVTVAAPT